MKAHCRDQEHHHRTSRCLRAAYYLGPDGKAQGYSIDICLKIAEAAKTELKLDTLEVKYVPLTPQTRIPLLTAGTIDMICETSTHTLGRLRQASFLNITFLTGSKLLVRKTSGIKKIEDLTDKVLVAVLGGTNERAAQFELEKRLQDQGRYVKVNDNAEAMLNLEGAAPTPSPRTTWCSSG
jgi:glutamate/aspartate transport system substrate-binding protein